MDGRAEPTLSSAMSRAYSTLTKVHEIGHKVALSCKGCVTNHPRVLSKGFPDFDNRVRGVSGLTE